MRSDRVNVIEVRRQKTDDEVIRDAEVSLLGGSVFRFPFAVSEVGRRIERRLSSLPDRFVGTTATLATLGSISSEVLRIFQEELSSAGYSPELYASATGGIKFSIVDGRCLIDLSPLLARFVAAP